MNAINYDDQRGIFDPDSFGWPVHVIGIGGIGSALIHPLSKLGIHELHLWDADDEVEAHNIPAQTIYRPSDIGRSKIEAALDFLERQEITQTCRVIGHAEAVTESTPLTGVVISGVDSMKSRRAIWDAVEVSGSVPLYMDGRIGGEEIQLLTIDPAGLNQADWYCRHWLFGDEEADELRCAERTVIHPPTELASLIITQLTLFVRKQRHTNNIKRQLPSLQQITEVIKEENEK